MKKLSRKQWIFIAIALLVFAGIKIAIISWYLKQQQTPGIQTISCSSLQQGCALPDGSTLRFASQPLNGKPFRITLDNSHAAEPAAEFSMVGMDMGFNRYRFVQNGSQWQANVTLPLCVSGSHDWLLDLHQGKDIYRLAFRSQ